MKTFRLDRAANGDQVAVAEEVDRLLSDGTRIAVTLAEEQELFSLQEVSRRLGFSRQHVRPYGRVVPRPRCDGCSGRV